MRSEALSTGEYDGQDEPEFGETQPGGGFPESATVRVYRKGIERPFVGIARWKEFYPGDGGSGFMWRKMPYHMLSKCAEALAMRKAFPQELGGLYAQEEMQRPDDAGNQGGGYSGTVRQTDKKPPGTSQTDPGATKGKKTAIDTLKGGGRLLLSGSEFTAGPPEAVDDLDRREGESPFRGELGEADREVGRERPGQAPRAS